MTTKSSTGLLTVAIAAGVVAVVTLGAARAVTTVERLLGQGDGTEVLGTGDDQVPIASSTDSIAKQCTVPQMLVDNRCGDVPVLVVNAARMPFIARNTKLAWEDGQPGILTMNRSKQDANRRNACPESFPRSHGGQCDEYPMASTNEGGRGAHTEEVPARENRCQGGSYNSQYPKDGQQFLVVISSPDLIATDAYAGTDIAKVQGYC
ncbi:MAG TPA: NucA/NucB deoxyribonuclease domain-containing protein [Pseudonocardiaceae bacterium]